MLWIHFKDYKPFLIFSTQFGCNFPHSSAEVRGSPERLDVTIITVHTLEEAPLSVVDAARHKLPHDVSVRYSTGTLLRLSLPPSSSAVPANHGRSLLKTVCPGESLSPLTFTMPIRPSSFGPLKGEGEPYKTNRDKWFAHAIHTGKHNTGLRGTLGYYLEGGGQMYALTAGHCCYAWSPPSPLNTVKDLNFPLHIQSPSEYSFISRFIKYRSAFDPCAEERLVEMWESERFFGSVNASAHFKDMTHFSSQSSSGFFLDHAAISVPKDIAPQENVIPYEFWYDSLPSVIFINVGFLQRDGQEYLSFDTVGPLPAVDTLISYYSSRGWRDAMLIAQTELVWMESNNSSLGGDVTSESHGKIAVMRCLSHSPIYNVLGELGESGSLVFTKDDGKLIAVGLLFAVVETGGHAGERYALVQSLEGILDDLRESIPDIRLLPSPVA